MKKTLRLLLLCIVVFFFQASLWAHTVVIKGTVKDSLHHPVANRTVRIYTSDSLSGCSLSHTVVTNPNGYYIDSLTCNNTLGHISVVVENCNGARILQEIAAGTQAVVEANFIICTPGTTTPATGCKAGFGFTQASNGIKFSAGVSTAPPGDSILSYTWNFGDGSAMANGTKDPLHVYEKPGIYTVCLTIKTKKGCESNTCKTVEYKPTTVSCKATASFTIEKIGPKKFRFNSSHSSVLAGDSIYQRIWKFGDGSSIDGNKTIVEKEFKDSGAYSVCLKITSVKGCDNQLCGTVYVHDSILPPNNCKALFTYTLTDSVVRFNSAASSASSLPGDSIVSRTWWYKDSLVQASLGGNVIAPSYPYTQPGTYKVSLVIKTMRGCESHTSVNVTIPPRPVACKAYYKFAAQGGTVKFTSTSHGATLADSIVSYTWIFGDSTVPVQNTSDPTHVFARNGLYTVTLYIKTKSGCESKYAETIKVTVTPPTTCAAEARFTAERAGNRKMQFNSSASKTNATDSILQRNWKFGDGTTLNGNEINPLKTFAQPGIYNVCLEIKTAKGCTVQTCQTVTVHDTITTPQSSVDYVKIISLNPNPVTTRMFATVFSRNTNTEAEITVYDIYGTPKLTIRKLLAQGNNLIEVNTGDLFRGPYFLKVGTRSGKDSKAFYKL